MPDWLIKRREPFSSSGGMMMTKKARVLLLVMFVFVTVVTSDNTDITATAKTTAGLGNAAYYFDGVDDIAEVQTLGGIMCTDKNNKFKQLENFTIEWWYYPMMDNVEGTGESGTILISGDSGGIDISEEGSFGGVKWGVATPPTERRGSNCHESKNKNQYLPDNEARRWVHLAITYNTDGGGGKSKKVMHINGVPTVSEQGGGGGGGDNSKTAGDDTDLECEDYSISNSGHLYLGGRLSPYFPGTVLHANKFMIDEMRVWTVALSADQIADRMHRVLTAAETASPDLLIYWDFDITEKGVISDRSTNGLNLELGVPGFLDSSSRSLKAREPKRVPSTAPLTGSAILKEIPPFKESIIELSGWDPLKKEIVTSSTASHNAIAEIVSLPQSGTLSVVGADTITSVPFAMASGSQLMFTPGTGMEGGTVEFEYTLTAAGSSASDPQKVTLKIQFNRPPIAGTGGRSISLGGEKRASFGFSPFEIPMKFNDPKGKKPMLLGGQFTVEYWMYLPKGQNSGLFYFDAGTTDSCDPSKGRYAAMGPCGGSVLGTFRQDRAIFMYGTSGYPRFTWVGPLLGKWTHFAWTACGFDPSCTGQGTLYVDGKKVQAWKQGVRHAPWDTRNGLTLGAKSDEWVTATIDEFRVWSKYRTAKQIRDHMHSTLKGGASVHDGLELNLAFNEPGDDELAEVSEDTSGNGRHMTWGGCAMNHYRGGEYDICTGRDQSLIVNDVFLPGRPPRVASSAPIGGTFDPVDIFAVHDTTDVEKSGTAVHLPGHDPDGEEVTFHVTALPERGTLLTSSGDLVEVGESLPSPTVTYIPFAYGGGPNYASFSYEVRDEILASEPLEVVFNVACLEGTELRAPFDHNCHNCPVGTFNPVPDGECQTCPANSRMEEAALTACVCDSGYEWQQESSECLKVGVPCSETGCSEYAECDSDGMYCGCKRGYQPEPGMDRGEIIQTSYHCELSIASHGEQRVLWSVTGYTNYISFVAILYTLYQYIRNPATKKVVMRSYLAVLIPDFVLVLVYLPLQTSNTLRGVDVDKGTCQIIGFLTYGAVIATILGPVIVAYIAYNHVVASTQKDSTSSTSHRGVSMFSLLIC